MPIRQAPTSGYAGSITATAPSSGVTLDRGIAYGGGDSSTFFQDLADQDRREALQDEADRIAAQLSGAASAEGGFDQGEIDAVTGLLNSGLVSVGDVASQFGLPASVVQAAYDANKPVQSTQGAYDYILGQSAITDTAGEFLGDVTAAQQGVDIALANLRANTGTDVTTYDPAQEAATAAAIGELTTAKENLTAAQQAALGSGLVSETDLGGDTFAQSVLSGVGNVLGTGTGALYNVASNIPVVGGALGDAIKGTADFFTETKGSATINPITGAVSGIWGIPDWMEPGSTSTIGNIANTAVGVTTGNEQLDAILGIITGDQDVGGETTGAATGVNQAILDAAKAAGTTAGELIEGGTATTALTDAEIAAEKEKNLAIATQVFEEAGGGADGVQAVLDTLEENDLTTADLADLTGVSETDINAFIDTTLTPTPTPSPEPPTPSPTPATITLTGGDGTTLSSDGTVMGPLTQEELEALVTTPSPEPPTPSPEPPTPSPEQPTPSPEPPNASPDPTRPTPQPATPHPHL